MALIKKNFDWVFFYKFWNRIWQTHAFISYGNSKQQQRWGRDSWPGGVSAPPLALPCSSSWQSWQSSKLHRLTFHLTIGQMQLSWGCGWWKGYFFLLSCLHGVLGSVAIIAIKETQSKPLLHWHWWQDRDKLSCIVPSFSCRLPAMRGTWPNGHHSPPPCLPWGGLPGEPYRLSLLYVAHQLQLSRRPHGDHRLCQARKPWPGQEVFS